jgi:hypothetical protein
MSAGAAGIVGLVVAVLIGVAAGWLLARRERDRAVAAAREAATAGTFQLADELYARTKRAIELESRLGAVRTQVGALKDAVAAADDRAHVLEAEAESRAQAALASRVAELRAKDDEIASLRAQLQAFEAASEAADRDQKPAVPGAPAAQPPSSRARRAARLPEDPRPAQQERSDDGSRPRDHPKRARKESRKKYGTEP